MRNYGVCLETISSKDSFSWKAGKRIKHGAKDQHNERASKNALSLRKHWGMLRKDLGGCQLLIFSKMVERRTTRRKDLSVVI
jgi:hypothetical protein